MRFIYVNIIYIFIIFLGWCWYPRYWWISRSTRVYWYRRAKRNQRKAGQIWPRIA